MPLVHVYLLKGRTAEQKEEMVKRVTEAITETTGAPKDAVTIVITELEREHLAVAGELYSKKP